jgi:CheY-like chemotaxis protein
MSLTPRTPIHPSEARVAGRSQPLLILVVDDDEECATTLAEFLQLELGCEIALAFNGSEALVHAKRQQPHTCLLDIQMPVMGGVECAGAMRAMWGQTPSLLIALSGGHSSEAHACGHFHHVLMKPPEMDQLIRLIVAG